MCTQTFTFDFLGQLLIFLLMTQLEDFNADPNYGNVL